MANRSNLPIAKLSKSTREGKKWMVDLLDKSGRSRFLPSKTEALLHFGAQGYQDYTQHKDKARRAAYIARHQTRENWDGPRGHA